MNTKINAAKSPPGVFNASTPANPQGKTTMDKILELMEVFYLIFCKFLELDKSFISPISSYQMCHLLDHGHFLFKLGHKSINLYHEAFFSNYVYQDKWHKVDLFHLTKYCMLIAIPFLMICPHPHHLHSTILCKSILCYHCLLYEHYEHFDLNKKT